MTKDTIMEDYDLFQIGNITRIITLSLENENGVLKLNDKESLDVIKNKFTMAYKRCSDFENEMGKVIGKSKVKYNHDAKNYETRILVKVYVELTYKEIELLHELYEEQLNYKRKREDIRLLLKYIKEQDYK